MQCNRRIQVPIPCALFLRASFERKGDLSERFGAGPVPLWEGDEGFAVCEDGVEEVEVGVAHVLAGVLGGHVVRLHEV